MAFNKTQQKATFRNTCEVKKVEILKIKIERQMHNGVPPPPPTTTRYNVLSVLSLCLVYEIGGCIIFWQNPFNPEEMHTKRTAEKRNQRHALGSGFRVPFKKNRRVAWRCPFCNTGGKHPVATSYCK